MVVADHLWSLVFATGTTNCSVGDRPTAICQGIQVSVSSPTKTDLTVFFFLRSD